jgi:hypothetical protein
VKSRDRILSLLKLNNLQQVKSIFTVRMLILLE